MLSLVGLSFLVELSPLVELSLAGSDGFVLARPRS